MTEITDLNPVDASNTALTGNGIQGTNFVSNFDNAMRSLLGLLGRLNSGAAPIADTFTIADPGDLTKRFRFDGGLITAGQTRVITVPDTNITLGAGTAASITFTPAGNIAATDVQAAIQELDTEKQAADSDLTAIAALSPSNDDVIQRKAGAWTNRTIAQLLTDLGAAGTTFQPLDAGLTDLAGLAVTDSNIIVGNGTNWVAESGATARTSLGLGTGNSPEFTAVNVGHASDTTITRVSAGNIAVEGNAIYRAGGTDVPLADGGTGASLTDPNADRIMFWDDSAGAVTWLAPGTGIAISGTSLDLDSDLQSWASVTRASGFDTFTAAPSSANLRSLLTDETGTGAAVFASAPAITDPVITGTITEDVYTISDGAAFAIDPRNGSVQTITLGASRTPTASGWVSGDSILLRVADGTAYTITWTTIGVVWVGGSAPTLATSGYSHIVLWYQGTTYYGKYVGDTAS